MDRRDTLRLEKELLDRSMENCREDIKLVYPVFLASGGYVFAHLEEVLNFDFSLKTWLGLAGFFWSLCVLSRLQWKMRAMQRKWDEKNF